MHEMSLAENVLQIIENAARNQDFHRVKTVWLEIGRLSCVEPDALRFAFDAVMHGSIAHGARLEIVEIPGRGVCLDCSSEAVITARYEACPACGSHKVRVTSGENMRVRELEVE
ncbi:putative hydrogenase nickel incorporation protein HypA 2 [Ferrigenium kumadai]|uniref:Hydrogenase maturation factor HypA n=1 Tax=Ferrigenium kumadai TaxID=1682490 RepID=A0AAN1T151_9PROT|nr:hydrogenase maturation nickel metallochaperone HypA [Ferrigenium kumadai]BBI99429.1 putative hydrogenase nickel incorporation protein HypA 2 [Ferrigenium kumadai]